MLQSMGSQRVGHDVATEQQRTRKMKMDGWIKGRRKRGRNH